MVGARLGRIVAASALIACTAEPPSTEPPPDWTRTPVLMVHGSGLGPDTWTPLIDHLLERGYPPGYLLAVDLVPDDGSNVRAAEVHLAPAVESLISASTAARRDRGLGAGEAKVDLVTHSMGAFSGRWYAAKIGPHRVRTWIGLAGAHHGSDALRGLAGEGNREMVPAFSDTPGDGNVQARLNGTRYSPRDETPWGLGTDPEGSPSVAPDGERSILYLSLWIDPDRWIRPTASAILAGAGGIELDLPADPDITRIQPGNLRIDRPIDHDDLPRDPRVIALVAHLLALRDG